MLFSNTELKNIRNQIKDTIKEHGIPESWANRIRCDFENALQIGNEMLTKKLADKNCPVREAYILAKHAFLDAFYPVSMREEYKKLQAKSFLPLLAFPMIENLLPYLPIIAGLAGFAAAVWFLFSVKRVYIDTPLNNGTRWKHRKVIWGKGVDCKG